MICLLPLYDVIIDLGTCEEFVVCMGFKKFRVCLCVRERGEEREREDGERGWTRRHFTSASAL